MIDLLFGNWNSFLKVVLADWGTSLPEEIPPTSLKKFATGNGNAIKENLIATAKKDWGKLSNDEADAAWLAEFACALNEGRTLTQVQLEAIRGIRKMKAPKYKPSRLNIINI